MRSDLTEAIKLLHKADTESIERALELLQETVFSFSMKVCGHREDAEDTVQEVLFRALPHLAALEDPQSLAAWLYTAARNRCWQSRRKVSYRKSVSLDDLMPDDTELAALDVADPGDTPEEHAASHEKHLMLHEAVLRLPPAYRMVLVLHDMEELDTGQVAKVLSLQPGTVRIRLHRARLMLRKEMANAFRHLPVQKTAKPRRHPAPECREIFANLSEYLDGEMEPETCEQMRQHISACPACVAFIEDLKRAIDRCRTLEVCSQGETAQVLRRLLAEEYLRLLKKSPARL